jgi:hypothetical protein
MYDVCLYLLRGFGAEVRAIQSSTDKEKLRSLPELVHQLEQNLLEV